MAVRLDADTDELSRTANLGDYTTGITIMGWFYMDSEVTANYEVFVSLRDTLFNDFISVYADPFYSPAPIIIESDGGTHEAGTMPVDMWVNVCLRIASASDARVYVNGVQGGGVHDPSLDSIERYSVGNLEGPYFNGRIAHVKAWDTALTDAQIFDEAAITYPRNALASLNFYWPLDSATDTADYGPNGRNPTISGTLTTEASPPFTILTLTPATLQARLSTKSGSAGDSLASSPATSLGKYLSTSPLSGAIGNLFRPVTAAEATDGVTTYRCLFFTNTHATVSLIGVRIWMAYYEPYGAEVAIGLDPAGVTADDSASAQAADIANEFTAPTGVSFTLNTTPLDGLKVLETVAPGDCFAVWVRRRVRPGVHASASDAVTLHIDGVEV